METQAMVIGGVEYQIRLDDSVPEEIIAILPDAHLQKFIDEMSAGIRLIIWGGEAT